MSAFTGLIDAAFKQLHADMILEVVRGASLSCQLVYGDSKRTDCPNCIYDSSLGRSSNRYKSGGPIPFTFGTCPYCEGEGYLLEEHTEDIDLAVIYDYKHWIGGVVVNTPNSYVQTISPFETYDALKEAKEVIINTATNSYVKARFERYGEPHPCGFGQATIVFTMWKRIEN